MSYTSSKENNSKFKLFCTNLKLTKFYISAVI